MIRVDMLRALFGAALVLRLLVDMATPLAPGAFRFDPHESVEGLRTHAVRAAEHVVVRPSPSPQPTTEPVVSRVDTRPRVAPDVRAPRFRPRLARQTADRIAETTEDH